jgi:hypothetical protein
MGWYSVGSRDSAADDPFGWRKQDSLVWRG